MILGRVIGTVVATQKDPALEGLRLVVVQPVDITTFDDSGAKIVALDVVGSGEGEVVMVVSGSSARLAGSFANSVPTDQAITAKIDSVEIEGKLVFSINEATS